MRRLAAQVALANAGLASLDLTSLDLTSLDLRSLDLRSLALGSLGSASHQARADKTGGAVSGSTAAPSHATHAMSGATCGFTLTGGAAVMGQWSARIRAALPTRCGAPNRDASSASSIGATRGRTNAPPSPVTTWT